MTHKRNSVASFIHHAQRVQLHTLPKTQEAPEQDFIEGVFQREGRVRLGQAVGPEQNLAGGVIRPKPRGSVRLAIVEGAGEEVKGVAVVVELPPESAGLEHGRSHRRRQFCTRRNTPNPDSTIRRRIPLRNEETRDRIGRPDRAPVLTHYLDMDAADAETVPIGCLKGSGSHFGGTVSVIVCGGAHRRSLQAW